MTRRPDPLVYDPLGGSSNTGLGGGEGAAYRSEVSEEHREPTTSRSPRRAGSRTALGEIAARLRVPEGTPSSSAGTSKG